MNDWIIWGFRFCGDCDSRCWLGGGQHLMPKPYSDDLRERVAALVEGGRSCRDTASLFGVSVASVVRWSQRKRSSGSAAARRMRRPPGTGAGGAPGLAAGTGWLGFSGQPAQPGGRPCRARCCGLSRFDLACVAGGRLQLQKNSVRQRAGQAGDRPTAGTMEEVSEPARSTPPGLRR